MPYSQDTNFGKQPRGFGMTTQTGSEGSAPADASASGGGFMDIFSKISPLLALGQSLSGGGGLQGALPLLLGGLGGALAQSLFGGEEKEGPRVPEPMKDEQGNLIPQGGGAGVSVPSPADMPPIPIVGQDQQMMAVRQKLMGQ